MTKILPYILIVIILIIAGGLYLQYGKSGAPITFLKPNQSKTNMTETNSLNENNKGIPFKNLGSAPEFTGIEKWLNSDALTMAQLKGKVVLVDFWTYSCINCIRTLPHITKWYETYKDQGFVVVGVHTPEFAFEKVVSNVETALQRYGINYPVALDNNYRTWEAYENQYWPAHYLIDKDGQVVYTHFGEGQYETTENAIRELLSLNKGLAKQEEKPNPNLNKVLSPEMYFGSSRSQYDVSVQSGKNSNYPAEIKVNQFAREGSWQIDKEQAILTKGPGKIKLKFNSGKVYMVAQSSKSNKLEITVDGKSMNSITVSESKLYPLFESEDYREHEIEFTIPEAGFEAFTFTFG